MAQNPPEGVQHVAPYLSYSDAPAAIDFLCRAFGFEERFRVPMPDGAIGHAELGLGQSVLMLATAWEAAGMKSPRELPALHGQVHCFVDDVDAHYLRARDAGATIASQPEDQFHGARMYRAVDLEGHRFMFATQMRDVSLEELTRPPA